MSAPQLVATCWTSAGDVGPLDVPELSPFSAVERVRAAAEAGWLGVGFGQDDLRRVRDTTGFSALDREIRDAGLAHVEVELASGWWRSDDGWRERWTLLLEAALDASMVFGVELSDAEEAVVGTLFEDTRDNRTLIGRGA
ncbi:hypothetical protein [Microbacterium halophytorum]|uniref:hypothetical protein n=1 Tax=Microbacterium halophytorum TaxID=2067568 RepID=UPI001E59B087|nr:hypothetical protein [Microbacterium halophytorum]